MWVLLRGARTIDPASGRDETGDVLIKDGRIAAIGRVDPAEELDGAGGSVYDCRGLVVAPGLIDMHVHLREPGYEHKETIQTGAEAAAAGGFARVVAMPNTNPAVDSRAVVEYVLREGDRTPIRVMTTCAATRANAGAEMAEIGDMVDAGAVAVSDDAFPIQSADLMRRVMEYCRGFDVPVFVHCEDKSMTVDAVMNEGITATVLGLRAWPRQAEEMMIWRNLLLAELTGCRVHIQHVTTAGGVEAVRWAKARGIRVTCETCPQYFSLTDEALSEYDTNAKCCPPLRTAADVEALRQALADGTVDVIATDHAPHAIEDKEVELHNAAFGMVGLETALPLAITHLVETGALSLTDVIRRMSVEPARALGIEAGTLAQGARADVTVIDPGAAVTVRASDFRSKGRNTPFDGMALQGRAVATIVDGRFAHGEESLRPIDARASV